MAHARAALVGRGATVDCVRLDLQDAASVAHLGEVASGFGSLAAVCLNAGVTSTGSTVWETAGRHLRLRRRGEPARSVPQHQDVRSEARRAGQCGRPGDHRVHGGHGGLALQRGLCGQQGGGHRPGQVIARRTGDGGALDPGRTAEPGHGQDQPHPHLGGTPAQRELRCPTSWCAGMHDALNQAGVEPDVAVSWALRALDRRTGSGRCPSRAIRSPQCWQPNSPNCAR